MGTRARKVNVAACRVESAPELDEEDDVRRRIASGELVRLPPGEAPVREHVLAQLRARLAAPRVPLPKKTG
jgi:hypothetical protein